MPAKSFFDLKTRAVPTRYSLSKNIQDLLIALDDFHHGSIDAVEIGRLVRLSPNRRAAIANTITKCANILKSQPTEVATCVDVIEMCTELLEIADRKPPIDGFPFFRLPVEIRERVFTLMIDNIFRTKSILPANNKIGNCKCPRFERDNTFQTSQMKDLTNIFGPNLITLEFFRVFFRTKTFRFRCPCELRTHLTNNGMFFDNVRKIVVQWSGPEAAMAFKQLKKVPKLKSLGIVISRLTYIHLNERSATMKNYFPLAYKNTRLSDILGLDELLEIRGLNLVEVMLAHSSRGGTQSHEMDRANLLELLSGRLTRPKGDDYDVELE
ncbi:uncharacterized protein TRIVIDRAFT_228475 [Trichoderma virens Gv29-8]|uniref:Uncharacterized protein n=1 Tax=Hypocrea virens (strain Gv29-8 / FGSC 10586) TaxID=413071 RepID=G9NCL9_HYPVG|nr:uncharacterized protein TRIVIDRAFT_228475 [Trichoderma virens Gv29-8]EHK15441.1 hypothetical protein TRIVIDRAFT_228475 [Trichoderma virens Gv29-8]UKZ51385.1 hypothetical protein TrVGV298_005144 [Trichoderma virens]